MTVLLCQNWHRRSLCLGAPFLSSDSAWLSPVTPKKEIRMTGNTCGPHQLPATLNTAPTTPWWGGVCVPIASEVCGSRNQVPGWHKSELTAQPTDCSIGYSVDLGFHSEMNLWSSDGDFSSGSQWPAPLQSFRQNNNPNLIVIWKLTFVTKSRVSGAGQIAGHFLAPALGAKRRQVTSY